MTIKIRLYVPDVNNNCPCAFPNPVWRRFRPSSPKGVPNLNRPVLHHVDIIGGSVTGKLQPGRAVHQHHERRRHQADRARARHEGRRQGLEVFHVPIHPDHELLFSSPGYQCSRQHQIYNRLSGESVVRCPGQKHHLHRPETRPNTPLGYDVAAWSNLWFYSNPIFFRVATAPNF